MANVTIIGCSTGLGLELVKRFLASKDISNVLALSRSESKALQELKQENPGRLHFYYTDVTEEDSVSSALSDASQHGRFHYMVYNAGLTYWERFHRIDLGTALDVINIKTLGLIGVLKHAEENLAEGCVIAAVGSSIYKSPSTVQTAYKTACWGQLAIMNDHRAVSYQEGKERTFVNFCIGPMYGTNAISNRSCPNEKLRKVIEDKHNNVDMSLPAHAVANRIHQTVTGDNIPFAVAIEHKNRGDNDQYLYYINTAFPTPW